MNNQLSLFDQDFSYHEASYSEGQNERKIIQFPLPAKKGNYRTGVSQTVYPMKEMNQIHAMAAWLKDNADRKYLLAFILGINLGLRGNELLSLRHSDIFFPNGDIRYTDSEADTIDEIVVYQRKTHKKRKLYLNDACVMAIEWYFGSYHPYDDKYIFKSREGKDRHITVDCLRKKLKEAAEACGLKQNIGTHSLRKTFGYHHFNANHDIVFLQRLFGHSNALITMRYIGMAAEEEREAYRTISINPFEDSTSFSLR